MRLTHSQISALELLLREPQTRGFFKSGWGPEKYGQRSNRVKISEPTANALIKRGMAEVVPDGPVIKITQKGIDFLKTQGNP